MERRSFSRKCFEFRQYLAPNPRYNTDMNKSLQNDIRQLPAAEQLEIAEFIYNSLATSKQLLTDEQLAETRRRSEQVRKEPESTLSSDEMWSEIENLKNARKN